MLRNLGDKKGLGLEKESARDKADFSLLTGAAGDKILIERMRRGEARLRDVRIQVMR